jgi:dUTP pyrophosphatase
MKSVPLYITEFEHGQFGMEAGYYFAFPDSEVEHLTPEHFAGPYPSRYAAINAAQAALADYFIAKENILDIKIKLLNPDANFPSYGSAEAAGMDLKADLSGEDVFQPLLDKRIVTLGAGERRLVKCGFAMALPKGFEAQVRPRSGLSLKSGITVHNAPGTIDSDYRGEVGVILWNTSNVPFAIRHGDRIAQMVIARHERAEIQIVEELDESDRGAGGFGSTGVQ